MQSKNTITIAQWWLVGAVCISCVLFGSQVLKLAPIYFQYVHAGCANLF